MCLLYQSGVIGGGLDPYSMQVLFVNIDNMWMERFGNYDCLVSFHFLERNGVNTIRKQQITLWNYIFRVPLINFLVEKAGPQSGTTTVCDAVKVKTCRQSKDADSKFA